MTTPAELSRSDVYTSRVIATGRPKVCWAAIIAGLIVAMGLQVLFMLLGSGLGFAVYNPITEENPIADLGAGALIVQGISAVLSLWFGGWIAGRYSPHSVRMNGCLHGFIVWCAATVAGVILVSGAAGWAMSDLSKLVGGGLSLAGKPAAAAAGGIADLAKQATERSGAALASFAEEAGAGRTSASPAESLRNKRNLAAALARYFNPQQPNDRAQARATLVNAVASNAGISEADADRMVTEWTRYYDEMKTELAAVKAEAEIKAREAAEKAANALAMFSLGAFVSFVIGAISASLGGKSGALCAAKHDVVIDPVV